MRGSMTPLSQRLSLSSPKSKRMSQGRAWRIWQINFSTSTTNWLSFTLDASSRATSLKLSSLRSSTKKYSYSTSGNWRLRLNLSSIYPSLTSGLRSLKTPRLRTSLTRFYSTFASIKMCTSCCLAFLSSLAVGRVARSLTSMKEVSSPLQSWCDLIWIGFFMQSWKSFIALASQWRVTRSTSP